MEEARTNESEALDASEAWQAIYAAPAFDFRPGRSAVAPALLRSPVQHRFRPLRPDTSLQRNLAGTPNPTVARE